MYAPPLFFALNTIACFGALRKRACCHECYREVCRQLPGDWQKRYNRLVCSASDGGDIDIPATAGGKCDLRRDDFRACAPGAWISDKIINTMACLLQV